MGYVYILTRCLYMYSEKEKDVMAGTSNPLKWGSSKPGQDR